MFVPITAPAALAPALAKDAAHQPSAREFMHLMCLAPGVTTDSALVQPASDCLRPRFRRHGAQQDHHQRDLQLAARQGSLSAAERAPARGAPVSGILSREL
jgi:hypothetical protein